MPAEQVHVDVRRELERRFSPEFLNRIDDIVLFSPLTPDEGRQIAEHYLGTVTAALAKAGKSLSVDAPAIRRLVGEGYSPAYGARMLKRVIDERVKVPISIRWHEGSHFRVGVDGNEVVVEPLSDACRVQAVA
jgi:ATP-dependent Clp protease ATP-binding subunit ClpA